MDKRVLGNSSIATSPLGLGCWAIGGPFTMDGHQDGWGQVDDAESIRAIRRAVDLGVTQPTATKHVAAVEARLGARLLNRNTRGVSATEIGALYYEKCKTIQRELEEADNLAALLQSRVGGQLRVSTSVAFGRRVLTPIVLAFMREHPEITIDLSFDDRYVNLVEQGVDVAIRMGRLADSSLGARYLAQNPWVLVASPSYLKAHGAPAAPATRSILSILSIPKAQAHHAKRFSCVRTRYLQNPPPPRRSSASAR